MSHFSVVVCIDDPAKLKDVLAPFDERLDVEPYRSYEKGDAADHWLYSALQRSARDYAEGAGIKPYDPKGLSFSSTASKQTADEQRAEQKADADLLATLPDPITWEALAKVYNECYAKYGDKLLVDESGRAYTLSTYNPESKWDYWRIGGRWSGHFVYRDGCASKVIKPDPGWDSPEVIMPMHCDGGPKSALDLDAMRNEALAKARKELAEWREVTKGTPPALPWSSFRENISDGNGYTADRAREEYHSQPRIAAIRETDFRWHNDPVSEFDGPENLFFERRRAQAVPGYAIVTTDGRWMAPGEVGWFAMATHTEDSRIGYWETANAYIEALPDETHLIVVDCHI